MFRFSRLEVLRDSMHGLPQVLGAREDRPRGARGRGRRRDLQPLLLGGGRPGPNDDIDGHVAVEEASLEADTIRVATRDGWQISLRGPKVRPAVTLLRRTRRSVRRGGETWRELVSRFRATPVLGFLPQELLGTSMYEYYHHDDISHLAESHKAALQTTERVTTQVIDISRRHFARSTGARTPLQ